MTKNTSARVLSIGQCSVDHAPIEQLFRRTFGLPVDQADRWQDAEPKLKQTAYALVLVNRKLDIDYTDGLEIIKHMQADALLRQIPIMLVSNYPEYQQEAVAAGALPGFGKAELSSQKTIGRLQQLLSPATAQ